jgi:uncharacterized protein (DUF2235 family)
MALFTDAALKLILLPKLQNSNVVEFFSRVVKDKNQLVYYDSGIGTYVKSSAKFSRAWERLLNVVDMAVAL